MEKLRKQITINAPVEKVFEFMVHPGGLPEVWPSMLEVKDVKPAQPGGHDFHWVYKMAGMRFEGESKIVEFVPNQRIVDKSSGGIESKFTWNYQPANGGTELILEIEYTVPVPLLGKLAEAFIVRQNEHEMETLLANYKARMES